LDWRNGIFGNWFGNQKQHFDGFYKIWSTAPIFNEYSKDIEKMQIVFSNPAMLKVFSLCCDLFSIGEVYAYKNGKSVDKDPFLDLINNPNRRQQKTQFLWDYCFWNMLGNAYLYIDSADVANPRNKMYFLEPHKLEWPLEMDMKKDKLFLSDASENELQSTTLTYRFDDGSTFKFPFKKLIHISDLSNGTGNWFKGQSRIDALYKVISNSEAALDSKNINVRYAGKYMVAGQADPKDHTKMPLGEDEKLSIEEKVNGPKNVHATKSMIDIKRFVENIANLKLDDSYLNDYFIIGSMYGIPKDVLEAFNSGTYENQEKARGAVVSYCLQPRANVWMNAFERKFNSGISYVMDWEHLPFMQVFAKERAETTKIKADTLLILLKAGIKLDEINVILDTNFSEVDYEPAKRTGSGQTGAGQGEGQQQIN